MVLAESFGAVDVRTLIQLDLSAISDAAQLCTISGGFRDSVFARAEGHPGCGGAHQRSYLSPALSPPLQRPLVWRRYCHRYCSGRWQRATGARPAHWRSSCWLHDCLAADLTARAAAASASRGSPRSLSSSGAAGRVARGPGVRCGGGLGYLVRCTSCANIPPPPPITFTGAPPLVLLRSARGSRKRAPPEPPAAQLQHALRHVQAQASVSGERHIFRRRSRAPLQYWAQ